MTWAVTEQAIDSYEAAAKHDPPTRSAMDRLWSRLDLDPEGEGLPLVDGSRAPDPNVRRIIAALENATSIHRAAGFEPRLAYEPIEGPAMNPPWLVFSVHAPNWAPEGRTERHTLLALGTVDRRGNIRT